MELIAVNNEFVLSSDVQNPDLMYSEAVAKINSKMGVIKSEISNRLLDRLNTSYFVKKMTSVQLLELLTLDCGDIREDFSTNLYFNLQNNDLDGQIRVLISNSGEISGVFIEG